MTQARQDPNIAIYDTRTHDRYSSQFLSELHKLPHLERTFTLIDKAKLRSLAPNYANLETPVVILASAPQSPISGMSAIAWILQYARNCPPPPPPPPSTASQRSAMTGPPPSDATQMEKAEYVWNKDGISSFDFNSQATELYSNYSTEGDYKISTESDLGSYQPNSHFSGLGETIEHFDVSDSGSGGKGGGSGSRRNGDTTADADKLKKLRSAQDDELRKQLGQHQAPFQGPTLVGTPNDKNPEKQRNTPTSYKDIQAQYANTQPQYNMSPSATSPFGIGTTNVGAGMGAGIGTGTRGVGGSTVFNPYQIPNQQRPPPSTQQYPMSNQPRQNVYRVR